MGTSPTVYFVGAGFSLGTLGGQPLLRPPISKDFVNELKKRVPDWAKEYREIAKVVDHLEKTPQHIGLEELWTCIDLHAKFPGSFPIPWEPRGPVVQQLKGALIRMYGRSCDALADRISPTDNCTALAVAKDMKAGDSLISFNYDTLVERLVGSKTVLRHGKDLKPETIRFAKPHGSASWSIGNLPFCVTDGDPILECLDQSQDALLLGAVPLKSELIYEVGEYYGARRVFEVIREQWLTVVNALQDAERVVVLGYSFPKEDLYGRFFLREAMSLRTCSKPLQVEFYNRSGDSRSIQEVFPTANPICFKGPVTAAEIQTTD